MTDFICLVMMAGYWLHFYHVLFPGVKDVKTATPEDFNLLITVINSAEVIFYVKKNTKGFTWFVSIFGLTSILSTLSILECPNYQSLIGSDRKITYGNQNTVCDRGINGWYRFEGAAGTRMPTSCPPIRRCNTHASGWLNGAHPTVADGQVTRTVCFHWGSNCCNWSRSVKVINCSDYYVYYITGTPTCSLRYCSTN